MEINCYEQNTERGRTIFIQTDTEALCMTTIVQAIQEAWSRNGSQDPVGIVIQLDQSELPAELVSNTLEAVNTTGEQNDAVCPFSDELSVKNTARIEDKPSVATDGDATLSAHYDSQDNKASQHVRVQPDTQNVQLSGENMNPEQYELAVALPPVSCNKDESDEKCYIRKVPSEVQLRCSPLNDNKPAESKTFYTYKNVNDKEVIDDVIEKSTNGQRVCSSSKSNSTCFHVMRDCDLAGNAKQKAGKTSPNEVKNPSHVLPARGQISNSICDCECNIPKSDSAYRKNNLASIKLVMIKGNTCFITGFQSSDSNKEEKNTHVNSDLVEITHNKYMNVKRRNGSVMQSVSKKASYKILQSDMPNKKEDGLHKLTSLKESVENENEYVPVFDSSENSRKCLKNIGCDKSDKFTCEICGRVFDRKFNLQRHLKSKRGHKKSMKKKYVPRPARCEVCGKMFHSTSAMCLHRRKHDDSLRYCCPHCKREFTQKGNLNCHIKTVHNGIKEVVCERCGKQFSSAASLVYHNQRVHLEEEMKYRYLQLGFRRNLHCNVQDRSECVSHVQVLDQVLYVCPVCPQTFMKIFGWFAHLNLHTILDHSDASVRERAMSIIAELQGTDGIFSDILLYPCTVCDYVAFSKSDAIKHLSRHAKEKLYSCEHCDQSFSTPSERSVHVQYHTKRFRHWCQICNTGFPLVGLLKSHLLNEHQVSMEDLPGSKGYRCDVCGKQFVYKTILKKHTASMHDRCKNYKCQTCGKAFKTRYSAELHLRTHTRDCRYSCEACGRLFVHPSNLIHHIKRLHKHLSPSVKQLQSEHQRHLHSNLHSLLVNACDSSDNVMN